MPLLPTATATPSKRKLNEHGKSISAKGEIYGATPYQLASAGFLPTPTTQENAHPDAWITLSGRREATEKGGAYTMNLADLAAHGMLPTPRAAMTGGIRESRKNDKNNNLETSLSRALLPTPMASDAGKSMNLAGKAFAARQTHARGVSLPEHMQRLGATSQLSHRFTLEMMGFPTDWLDTPFQDGGKNSTGQSEMP